ncbi:MAG TPA: hypothetical protein PKD73_06110 [Burkholderiaceae bacterium]|nr:hypothetical protein [Burkholderiaceae bacterium]
MDIAFVIDRVRTQVIALRQVGGAADMDAALEAAPAVPCAFVIPLGERGQLIGSTQITRQSLHRAIGVVIGIANRRDAKGQASMQDLAPLRQALKVALIGFVPNAANGEPMSFTEGHLLRLDGDGYLWWLDAFTYQDFYRS